MAYGHNMEQLIKSLNEALGALEALLQDMKAINLDLKRIIAEGNNSDEKNTPEEDR